VHGDTGRGQRVGGVAEQVQGLVIGEPQLIWGGVLEQAPQRWPGAGAAPQRQQHLGLGARPEQPLGARGVAPYLGGFHDQGRVVRGVQLHHDPELLAAPLGPIHPQRHRDLRGERRVRLLRPLTQAGQRTYLTPGVRCVAGGQRDRRGADERVGDGVTELPDQRGRFDDAYGSGPRLGHAVGVRWKGGGQLGERLAVRGFERPDAPGVIGLGSERGVQASFGQQPQRESGGRRPGGGGRVDQRPGRRGRRGPVTGRRHARPRHARYAESGRHRREQRGDGHGDRHRPALDDTPPYAAPVR
jgi:hypothetical protein